RRYYRGTAQLSSLSHSSISERLSVGPEGRAAPTVLSLLDAALCTQALLFRRTGLGSRNPLQESVPPVVGNRYRQLFQRRSELLDAELPDRVLLCTRHVKRRQHRGGNEAAQRPPTFSIRRPIADNLQHLLARTLELVAGIAAEARPLLDPGL